ncbi:ankyrin repeat domain-containing protein [Endozoicomonas sp. ONNA2]|uniref:ankyrin repeat domain-containing protein n=1 Tax=Endozoicomonas sp. ONNA2 TaxID=2828741 RepID=UPI0021476B1C|nr:ankyrin repeat domain-containing protein [Endozoicomonas sp. ONNA2]
MFSNTRTPHTEKLAADASEASTVACSPSNNTTAEEQLAAAAAPASDGRLAVKEDLPQKLRKQEKLMSAAILQRDLATVNQLLDQGVDPNIRSKYGDTPLSRAIGLKHPEEIINTLLDRGANPDLPFPTSVLGHSTPFLQAAKLSNYKAFKLLLDRGADRFACDSRGRTALHLATIYGCSNYGNSSKMTRVLNCLLEKGADINALDSNGCTALLNAVIHNSAVGINILLQGGANPNIPDQQGRTPLCRAVACYNYPRDNMEVFNNLLAYGANPNQPGEYGNTPLHLALITNRPQMVKILLAYGAHADIPDAHGQTAKDISVAIKNVNIIAILANYIPVHQPETLMACARSSIRTRLIKNRVSLAQALAPDSEWLPVSKDMKAYLYQPLTL